LVVEYAVGVGECSQTLERAAVSETPTTVTVRLLPAALASSSPPAYCLGQVLLRTTTVQLESPLGHREVVDGTNGRTLAVDG
jgi:hypothetical protein